MRSSSKAIGANIKHLRIERNMTQDELAEAVFVTRQTISNYETGRSNPDIDMLLKIAEAFGTEIDRLLYGELLSEERQAAQRRLRGSFIVLVSFVVAAAVLYPLTDSMKTNRYIFAPYYMVRLSIIPALMFVVGWTVMQTIDCVIGFKRRPSKFKKRYWLTACGILAFHIAMVVPFIGWLFVAMCRELANAASIQMAFPSIPIYQETLHLFIGLMYHAPFTYALIGMIIWFLRPKKEIP